MTQQLKIQDKEFSTREIEKYQFTCQESPLDLRQEFSVESLHAKRILDNTLKVLEKEKFVKIRILYNPR